MHTIVRCLRLLWSQCCLRVCRVAPLMGKMAAASSQSTHSSPHYMHGPPLMKVSMEASLRNSRMSLLRDYIECERLVERLQNLQSKECTNSRDTLHTPKTHIESSLSLYKSAAPVAAILFARPEWWEMGDRELCVAHTDIGLVDDDAYTSITTEKKHNIRVVVRSTDHQYVSL